MARFQIEATWLTDGDGEAAVDLVFRRSVPLEAAHDRLRGATRGWREIGRHRISNLMDMTNKRVEAIALEWLDEHEGATEGDGYILTLSTSLTREALARLETMLVT